MPSPTLQQIYASAPPDAALVQTLEIAVPGHSKIYVCNGYENFAAKLETAQSVTFECGNLSISRPKRSEKTKQTLKFGVWNATFRILDATEAAENTTSESFVYYREYNYDDP